MVICRQDIYTDLMYGEYPVSYNGCGVIATYNALKLKGHTGEEYSFLRILKDFEELGYPRLKGKWGTKPSKIGRYMKKRGIRARRCFRSGRKLDQILTPGAVVVVAVWNKHPLKNGMHLFTCLRTETGWDTWNRHYRNGPLSYKTFRDILEDDTRLYVLVL